MIIGSKLKSRPVPTKLQNFSFIQQKKLQNSSFIQQKIKSSINPTKFYNFGNGSNQTF